MRDPKRINRILRKLSKKWKENPDLRLTQLLYNAEHCANGDSRIRDIFYIEDEVIEHGLDTWK